MTVRCGAWFVGKDDAEVVAHTCASLPRDLSQKAIARFNLDPHAPWPCAERARTLWPHPVRAAIERDRPPGGLKRCDPALSMDRRWLRSSWPLMAIPSRPSQLRVTSAAGRISAVRVVDVRFPAV